MNYEKKSYHGYERLDFIFEDRYAILVLPKKPSEGHKWLLKAEYFDAFPSFELEMLDRGYYLAYLSNKTRWFVPDDAHGKARFARYLRKEFGLHPKCLPVGMSCGGMHAVYFAAEHPEHAAALYLDAPVLNLLSCPCGAGIAEKTELYDEFVRHTGKTASDLLNYRNHPVDRVGELIANRIPVFLVCGGRDTVVPYCENGQYLAEAYRKSDVPFQEILKPDCGHHPHGLPDNGPLIEFFMKHYE